jgi:hypothetical protein
VSPSIADAVSLPLPIDLPVPADAAAPIDWSVLPRRAGVFALEDDHGRTLGLSVASDLRRLVRRRLEPAGARQPSRRIAYREVTRRVRATTVGSAFEADWAFLHLARRRLPAVYRSLLDRWQAWFVHCNPLADFPRWTKTAHPDRPPAGPDGTVIGPFPDKHVAARFIEMIEDAFDLCRYHHVLMQSPRGQACAYKEMGRCPAPCDGTIGLDAYRQQVQESIRFASTSAAERRAALSAAMVAAGEALDFESAARLRRRLDVTAPGSRPSMQIARPLHAFRHLAVMPSEQPGHARLFRIDHAGIQPWTDVAVPPDRATLDELIDVVLSPVDDIATTTTETGLEDIGLVCNDLFRPASKRRGVPGRFLRVPEELERRRLAAAMRQVAGAGDEAVAVISEQSIDDPAPADPS